MFPVTRQEDKIVRAMHRAADGLYSGQSASFTAEAAAVEITLANGGSGPCGTPDEFGRCSARYHESGCSHDVGVDWLASGPHPATGEAALANFAAGVELANLGTGRTIWGDPDDDEQPGYLMPQRIVELAASLADDWGLHGDTPSYPAAPGWQELMGPPAAPVSVQDELLTGMGYELQPQPQPQRPGIRELAERMGLR